MIGRSDIIKAARGWIGTPFHHQGRVKGQGCDCIGLVVGVVKELELKNKEQDKFLHEFDMAGYPKLPDGKILKQELSKCLKEENSYDVGDVLLIEFDGMPQHVGIVSDYKDGVGIIHCYAQSKKVIEHSLDDWWKKRVTASFSFYGLE